MNRQEKSTSRRWIQKIKAIQFLGGKCMSCGTDNVKHLTFHHLDPSIKEKQISYLISGSWSKIEEELKKCILYCYNCHAEYHFTEDCKKYTEVRVSKKTYIEYKGNTGCKKCGYNKCQAALSFHHLDEKSKKFEISSSTKIFRSIYSITEEIINELDKCDLLCINCHLEDRVDENVLKYVLDNYSKLKIRKKQPKINRDLVEDMYFNKNMKQCDIRKELNTTKSAISMIIKEIKISKKLL